ncbi:DUF177 domain-containing protein [Ideonella sp. 4Y16]|uniref:Large ribosomal RNA subunit accumulation protein YceD n=1 Tax=Ideonella alba TaxID=2824118 RepID=A0A941BAC1_9BURK|nr:YceD family protein [Ideonella alba]MBQ0929655.1 DUF177 domain-containing protein [Ideonella alba]MBQ0941897.1 DUF177 domain-containing protein [Ideonella alba]
MKPKSRSHDPLKLDMAAFAGDHGELAGDWPLQTLPRLAESAMPEASADAVVHWQARGELRPLPDGTAEVWLQLKADVRLALCCQRCLGPVEETVALDRALRFVADEHQAAALDAELEDDVLSLERALDLRELVEDELLLALPLVPRHADCPQPLPLAGDDEPEEERPNPFAVLAALKGQGGRGTG